MVTIDTTRLFMKIAENYPLHLAGMHGARHWARVCDNGLRLAESTGADPIVVQLFALFHDSCRQNDGHDPDHGRHGAELAAEWRGDLYEVDDIRFELLHEACSGHADGGTSDHDTIGTCWDADRLDLPRVNMPTERAYLSTRAAFDPTIMNWAGGRAAMDYPSDRLSEWGFRQASWREL